MTESLLNRSALTRRRFLTSVSAGSLVLMAKLTPAKDVDVVLADDASVDDFAPDFFVSVAPDSTVTILAHRSEMGTGIRTMLPRIVADELEADWDRVVIQQAPGDKRLGDQNTDGSNSIRFFFDRMRVAGATARTMLEQAAAKTWSVDADQCYAEDHLI
ncbi:MAG: molybdopterin cofactor-binding domain-containing protein, partial [Planctomycetota bacterium]